MTIRFVWVAVCGVLAWLGWSAAAMAQGDTADAGRDFPKTLTLDEPGIDDEISFPTLLHIGGAGTGDGRRANEDDISIEIDKRLTANWDIQLNSGYRELSVTGGGRQQGWDNTDLTSKLVVLDQRDTESIVTLGIIREFASGDSRVGAETVGSTQPILYFGQGFGAMRLPELLRPFALTGGLGYVWPDRPRQDGGQRTARLLQLDTSVQYSLTYLSAAIARAGLPPAVQRLVAIVEITYADPVSADAAPDARQGFAAPGLIYAADGYQLAAEAVLPLTRASGRGVGAIAQLNVSFARLGLGRFATSLW